MINKKKLANILKAMPEIKLAYLIGSIAKKSQRKDSDLDIVLVVDTKNVEKINYGKLYFLLTKVVDHPNLDLRLLTPQENDPLFLFEVASGQLLYAKNGRERITFEKKAMLFYYDSQHLRNIFQHYLNQRLKRNHYGR